ncbi:MAG: hypothetical protein ACI88L_000088 [Candidatus Paceibacteria bacterium]|jgi:hypothetical protein
MKKIFITSIIGGIALNLAGFLTFGLLGTGMDFNGILTGPGMQNDKVVAVWHALEPLPLSVTAPWIIALGYFVLAFVFAWVYKLYLAGRFSRKIRIFRLYLLILIPFLFWEFNTPINLMGEPWLLVLLDIAFWNIMAFVGAIGIAVVYDKT